MKRELLGMLLCCAGIGALQGSDSEPCSRPASCPPVVEGSAGAGTTLPDGARFSLHDPRNTQILQLIMQCQALQAEVKKQSTYECPQEEDASAVRAVRAEGTLLASISGQLQQLGTGLLGLWQNAMAGSVHAAGPVQQSVSSVAVGEAGDVSHTVPLPAAAGWSQENIAQLIKVEGDSIRAEMTGMLASSMQGTRFYNAPEVVQNHELCEGIVRCAFGKTEQGNEAFDRLRELAQPRQSIFCWRRRTPRRSISQVGPIPLRPPSPSLSGYQRDGVGIALAQLHPTPVFPAEVTEDTVEQYLQEEMENLRRDIKAELVSQGRAYAILELSKAFENRETCQALVSAGLGTDAYARLVALAGGAQKESVQRPSVEPVDSQCGRGRAAGGAGGDGLVFV